MAFIDAPTAYNQPATGGSYGGYTPDVGTSQMAATGPSPTGPSGMQQFSSALSAMPMPGSGGGDGTMGAVSGGLDVAGNVGLASGNPYGMAVGGAAKLAGMGLGMYGKYQAREEAKKKYEMELAEYRRAKKLEEEDRRRELERQKLQSSYYASDFASNLGSELSGQYQGYRQPTGA